MSAEFLLFLCAGAAVGGFVSGLAGFGTALFALGFFLQIMQPVEAVSLAVLLSIANGIAGIWVVRKALLHKPLRLARFVAPALAGVPVGMAILSITNVSALKLLLAGLLIAYGGYFAGRRTLPQIARPLPVIDALAGFLGGMLGGLASISGIVPTMWCSMRPWSKVETRAILQPLNIAVLTLAAMLFTMGGVYDGDSVVNFAVALPVSLLFTLCGLLSFRRLSDQRFRRLLIVLCLLSGIMLLVRQLL